MAVVDVTGADRKVTVLGRIARARALAPFQVRSFRFQWPADLATSWAFEMETLILSWYVLVETGSVMLLSLFATLPFAGTLIAPLFGLLGDRIGHRILLCAMRAFYTGMAAILTLLALTGTLTPLLAFIIAALQGVVRSSDLVMRNALIGETLPADQLVGAMSLARVTADSARVAGALAGAGIVTALGMAPAYAVICVFYGVSLLLTLGIARARRVLSTGAASPFRDIKEAAVAVYAVPSQFAAMCLAFLVNLTAFPFSHGLLPYVAREVYVVDQTWLGYLVASFAGGALVGSVLVGSRSNGIRPARMMMVFCVAWYVMLLVFARTESALAGLVVLGLTGFVHNLSLVPMSVLLLRGARPELRGRVMGLRMLAVYGLPLGLVAAGPLIARWGFATAATIYAAIGLLCTLAILVRWRADLWPADAPANAR